MSLIPTGYASFQTACYPQFSQGVYIGVNPGTASNVNKATPYGGGDGIATGAGLTIQTDGNIGNYMSTMSDQPQNVLRLTGAFGQGFIQGSNIAFALPFSGTAGVRILPGANEIDVRNLSFLSSAKILNSGGTGTAQNINLQQLGSTIQGYGWANCA